MQNQNVLIRVRTYSDGSIGFMRAIDKWMEPMNIANTYTMKVKEEIFA